MPTISVRGVNYNYDEYGSGEETLVFSHGMLFAGWMFEHQVEYFKNKYRVITYDFRGQGKTQITDDGYDIDSLYEDTVELIRALCPKPVIYVGLSMGGFVGMRLAARNPELVEKLILLDTTCKEEPFENIPKYKMMNNIVRTVGYWPVEKNIMEIMFGDSFLKDKSRKPLYDLYLSRFKQNNKSAVVKAVLGVVERKGIQFELKNIVCPTLIVRGSEDKQVTLERSLMIHENIKGSVHVEIEGAGHSGTLEEPDKYNKAIEDFIS
ncbi:alpha/beta hydrolase [Emticicia sp. CRIBPO]|uniref:alpha/beta fold hydrolase n=1 Tax=Emticicia sp. CRIBPO TaxID=2683258 RepID=UPI00286DC5D5|nr:alpha/beta hydrolase [Emticicia sp. CRIBPO]